MSRRVDSVKIQAWTDRLDRFERTDLSVARYCETEGVSEASFYYWKKKLRHVSSNSRDAATARTAESSSAGQAEGSFQAVRISSPASRLACQETMIQHGSTTIHFGEGFRIELGGDLQVAKVVVKQVLDAACNLRHVASSTGVG